MAGWALTACILIRVHARPREWVSVDDLASHVAVTVPTLLAQVQQMLEHAQLVPAAEQLAVYRSWNALTRLDGTGKRAPKQLLADYLAAKDAAIASARAALGRPAPAEKTFEEAGQ